MPQTEVSSGHTTWYQVVLLSEVLSQGQHSDSHNPTNQLTPSQEKTEIKTSIWDRSGGGGAGLRVARRVFVVPLVTPKEPTHTPHSPSNTCAHHRLTDSGVSDVGLACTCPSPSVVSVWRERMRRKEGGAEGTCTNLSVTQVTVSLAGGQRISPHPLPQYLHSCDINSVTSLI